MGAIAFPPALISTAVGIIQIAPGLTMLRAALIANPVVLVIAAVAAGAALIYLNWEPIMALFVELSQGHRTGHRRIRDRHRPRTLLALQGTPNLADDGAARLVVCSVTQLGLEILNQALVIVVPVAMTCQFRIEAWRR